MVHMVPHRSWQVIIGCHVNLYICLRLDVISRAFGLCGTRGMAAGCWLWLVDLAFWRVDNWFSRIHWAMVGIDSIPTSSISSSAMFLWHSWVQGLFVGFWGHCWFWGASLVLAGCGLVDLAFWRVDNWFSRIHWAMVGIDSIPTTSISSDAMFLWYG